MPVPFVPDTFPSSRANVCLIDQQITVHIDQVATLIGCDDDILPQFDHLSRLIVVDGLGEQASRVLDAAEVVRMGDAASTLTPISLVG